MIRRIFKWFGFYKISWGFTCGRHWMEIDGKVIAQTPGNDMWMRDLEIELLQMFLEGKTREEIGIERERREDFPYCSK